MNKTLNPQVDKERHPLVGDMPIHTSSSNENTAWLLKL